MNKNKDGELADAVLKAAREEDGKMKLSCADALALAAEHDVAPLVVGRICNEKKIKIGKCQLGCFR